MSIKIDKLIFGLEEEVTIPGTVSKQCRLLQSHYVVARRLLGGDFVGGEITVNPIAFYLFLILMEYRAGA